jgi:methylated-DNA-[protein]-cysteine S-methyltransferase
MTAEDNYSTIVESPVGYLGLQLDGQTLIGIDFLGRRISSNQELCLNKLSNESVKRIQSALNDYFSDPEKVRPPATLLNGTEFQKKVWHVLSLIKPGQTRTYGDIAGEIDSSPRAVGNACRRNPIPIFIPCHRVVSASGRGGFMGKTSGEAMDIKEWLLANEQKTSAAK